MTKYLACAMTLALTAAALGEGGSITGVIKFDKNTAQPPRKPIDMAGGDPQCIKYWAAKKVVPLQERYIFGKENTLANVFVWVSKGLEGKDFPVPKQPVLIDQEGCMYSPHVTAVMVGQTLQIRNSDTTLHNVHIIPDTKRSGNPELNIGQPGKGITTPVVFKNAEEEGILITCNVHGWMNSRVHVVPHPFFAVSDADGKFTIKGLPPGEYELSTRHEYRVLQPDQAVIKVTVKEGEEAKVEVTYAPKKPTPTK